MRQNEIQQIEAELGITLPNYYKDFLLNYPYEKFKDLPNGGNIIPVQELLSFAKRKTSNENEYGIIDINLYMNCHNNQREDGVTNKLIIGMWDADYFLIDLSDYNNTTVYRIQSEYDYYENYNKETNLWNWGNMKEANSISAFIEKLIEEYNRE